MIIKVLGSGCARCRSLLKSVREAAADMKLEAAIEEVTDIKDIMQYSILMTPGLVIDGKVVSSGSVLKKEEVKKLLVKALAQDK